jgi:N-carbamoylputrescine amidase
VTCDRQHQETVRRHWPFLRDRRIDAYGDITRRFIDQPAADEPARPSRDE